MTFCLHKWSKWSVVLREYGGGLHQVAKCEKCGAISSRKAISIFRAHLSAEQVNAALAKDQV
jgi:hypothetical protein